MRFAPQRKEFRSNWALLIRYAMGIPDLRSARVEVQPDFLPQWSVTAWSKNLTDEEYNAEFSPGGFLFRATPRRYAIEFGYKF